MPISVLMSKMFFIKYLPIGAIMKDDQNLLKFGKIDIPNMPISILMSKMVFIKYVAPVRCKLVQN